MTEKKSLGGRLVLGLVLINLFACCIVGFSLYQSRQQYAGRISVSTKNIADSLAISIAGKLDKMDVALFAVAKEAKRQLSQGGIDRELLNGYLIDQHRYIPELEELWVADAEGIVRYGTLIPKNQTSIADREYFSRIKNGSEDELVISKPIIGRVTKTWSILVCKRITRPDGSFAGVALGSLRFVDFFSSMFSHLDIGKDGAITLLDDDLRLISRYPRKFDERIGSRVLDSKAVSLLRINPTAGSSTGVSTFDGIERNVSYRKIPGSPFCLFVGQSTQEYLAPWRKEAAIVLSLLLSFMTFTTVLAWIIKRRAQETFTLRLAERRSEDLEKMNSKLMQEVDEREKAQSALLEAKTQLRSIIDSTSDFVWSVDPESFRLSSFNSGFQKYLADVYGVEVKIGMPPQELFPSLESAQQWSELYQQAVQQGSYRTEYVAFNGKFIFDLSLNLLSNDGTLFGISIFAKNITKSHLDLIQLRELSQRLNLAISSANLAILDWSVASNVMLCDERMCEMYGFTGNTDIKGIGTWLGRLHPDDRDGTWGALQSALRGEAVFDTSFRIVMPEGEERYMKANGLVIRGEDGAAVRMLVTNQDITASKKDQEEKLNLKTQLYQSQKMESIGRLAGGIAHDFNNMLFVIIGNAELAKFRLPQDHPLLTNVEQILKASQRSSQITRQLLAFSRKQVINPQPVNLNLSILESEKHLGRLIGEDIKLTFRCGGDLGTVLIDPSQLDQILMNLWVNARDAMPDGGCLTVETSNVRLSEEYTQHQIDAPPGDYVLLTISDTGCGMDRETRERIFEPFFTTKSVGKGTGLGLSTVYGIVTQNNGIINCYSEPGQGTVFKVYLPQIQQEAVVEKETTTRPPSGSGKILLVEDEEMLRSTATRMLQELGYSVIQAATPQQAIALCQEGESVDLILTDVVMPEMNGRQMAERIREIRPELRVLFMSGYTTDTIVQRGMLNERMNFIEKPLDISQLGEKIREALQ